MLILNLVLAIGGATIVWNFGEVGLWLGFAPFLVGVINICSS